MTDLSALTNEQLAETFAELSRQQGTALENEDTKRYNRLFDKINVVKEELRTRGSDARKVLIPLLAASTKDPAWSYQAAQNSL